MITLTPAAVEVIKQCGKDQAMRIGVLGGGCSGFQYAMQFEPGEPREGDTVLDFDGVRVYVDQMSAMYLDGTVLDYVKTLQQSGFTFKNPNVKTTCGCGKSFSA